MSTFTCRSTFLYDLNGDILNQALVAVESTLQEKNRQIMMKLAYRSSSYLFYGK
jgi:hypothetical protein